MRIKIWLALLAVYVAWGSTYLAIRVAVETMPPFLMAGLRFLTAGAIMYGFRRLMGDAPPTRREWRSTAIVGLLLLLGGNGLVSWSEQYVPSGIAALLIAASPLWMVLAAAVWPGRRELPNRMTLAGVFIGFSGIVLLVGPGQVSGLEDSRQGMATAALLVGALLWSIGSLYSRQAVMPSSALLSTGMEMLAGGAGLFVVGTLAGEWSRFDLAAISTRSWLGLAYLIVFGSLVGYAAFTWLLRVAPTPLVFTYAYVNPLVAVVVGYLILAEPLTMRIAVAALIIAGSVFLINRARTSTSTPSLAAVEAAPEHGD